MWVFGTCGPNSKSHQAALLFPIQVTGSKTIKRLWFAKAAPKEVINMGSIVSSIEAVEYRGSIPFFTSASWWCSDKNDRDGRGGQSEEQRAEERENHC
jgi:hypothetical protein